MKQIDFDSFVALLTTAADYYNKTLQPATIQLYWNALSKLEFATVKALLNQHVQTSRFMPTIAEVLDAAVSLDGRPEAEEAWSIVARSLNDERVTVVWTEEMAQAFGVALGLQHDRIASRMAFKEAYERFVMESRRAGKPVKWSASLGQDPMGREGPLIAAVKTGKLLPNHVRGLLPSNITPSAEIMALMNDKPKELAA